MINTLLSHRTANDIEVQVDRILKDLGNPEPPLRLENVRELLRLDLAYYSKTSPSYLEKMAHVLKVSGKQILARPTLLWDVVKKFDLRALLVPDQKRILIDNELPAPKQRWAEAHECCHQLLDWHQDCMMGDDQSTLVPACHTQIEAEANYGAGELLFLRNKFRDTLGSANVNMDLVKGVAKVFGNSLTTTLWRLVEKSDKPTLGLIGGHPRHGTPEANEETPCRYLIRSRAFETHFKQLTKVDLHRAVCTYSTYSRGGPLGAGEVVLSDVNGEEHLFLFDTFFNRYDALTVGSYIGRRNPVYLVS